MTLKKEVESFAYGDPIIDINVLFSLAKFEMYSFCNKSKDHIAFLSPLS